jgi:hypothetical protein
MLIVIEAVLSPGLKVPISAPLGEIGLWAEVAILHEWL